MINISRVPERGKVAAPKSMNASFNGDPYLVERLTGFSLMVKVTETSATLAGGMKLQASNNCFQDNVNSEVRADAAWFDIESSDVSVSGSGSFIWNVPDVYYEAVRIVWTRSSGQGTAESYFIAKE